MLLHNQGGCYNSLVLQALELLPKLLRRWPNEADVDFVDILIFYRVQRIGQMTVWSPLHPPPQPIKYQQALPEDWPIKTRRYWPINMHLMIFLAQQPCQLPPDGRPRHQVSFIDSYNHSAHAQPLRHVVGSNIWRLDLSECAYKFLTCTYDPSVLNFLWAQLQTRMRVFLWLCR